MKIKSITFLLVLSLTLLVACAPLEQPAYYRGYFDGCVRLEQFIGGKTLFEILASCQAITHDAQAKNQYGQPSEGWP
jgi:hypothetical protein